MDDDQVKELLQQMAAALTKGSAKAVAKCFDTPAMVLADGGVATLLSKRGQVEKMFKGAIDWYRGQGIVATRARGARIRALSETLSQVDVEWPSFDEAGTEVATERSHYIVAAGKGGKPRIRVALSRQAQG